MPLRSLSIVIPSYNEGRTIGNFAFEISNLLESLFKEQILEDYEIIILNDGSSDNTKKILDNAKLSRTKIISNERPSGIHNAFFRLYKEAKMFWVLLVPGDAEWPVHEIERLIRFHFGTDNLYPTLTMRRIKSGYSRLRIILSNMFGLFAGLFFDSTEPRDPGSIKILPNAISNNTFVCNSVLIEIERIMLSEIQFKHLRQLEVDTVTRIHGESSTLSVTTIGPAIKDSMKLLITYKLFPKRRMKI